MGKQYLINGHSMLKERIKSIENLVVSGTIFILEY
ncbi:hypothetical protein DSM01_1766 [Leeuwenhoekiella palythoae]|uniref:Uncharacterized protein n=1 Tax=Leeuwenhoekiella palythoae TaxID=573501 RepID=A0ABY0D3Y8_9FLAO|nr:hypothetical protein DSM01_1766 [Leeuwenhoekiella palythoae]